MRNRVTEIQGLVSSDNWFHCPGKDNPADLISRGVMAEQLVSSEEWLNGPAWLSLPLDNFNQKKQMLPYEICGNSEVIFCVSVKTLPIVFEFTRCSTFCKSLNVVAWTMRFITNCKSGGKKYSGPLTYEELTKAKVKLLAFVQRDAFSNEIEAL